VQERIGKTHGAPTIPHHTANIQHPVQLHPHPSSALPSSPSPHTLRARMKLLIALSAFAMISSAALAEGPVRHVVHFKFKKDATPEQIENLCTEFGNLRLKIKVIESLEWGTNSSPEGLDKGYTHCWILSFNSEKARDFYLQHPAHQAFVALAKPLIEDALVVDFIPSKKAAPHPVRQNRGIDKAWGAQKTG
jgi:hypothetical protein